MSVNTGFMFQLYRMRKKNENMASVFCVPDFTRQAVVMPRGSNHENPHIVHFANSVTL